MPIPLKVCATALVLKTVVEVESSVKLNSNALRGSPFIEMELFSKFTRNGEQPKVLSGAITAKGLASTVIGGADDAPH